MASGLFICLFADSVRETSSGFLGSIVTEINAVLRDPQTQWLIFLCLGIYFVAFPFFYFRRGEFRESQFSSHSILGLGPPVFTHPMFWLACVLLINAVVYAFNYSPSIQAITLLAGAVLGQGAAVWTCFEMRNQKSDVRNNFGVLVVSLLMILLVLASVWNVDSGLVFEYRSHARWSGPWDNPNIFGLLMGMGIVLAIGSAVLNFGFLVFSKSNAGSWKGYGRWWKVIFVVLCLIAAGLMARGLLHSYSRGAWMAAICGLAYLVNKVFSFPRLRQRLRRGEQFSTFSQWLRRNAPFLAIIVLSLCALAFWQSRQTDGAIARRAVSVGNMNDFSWRNRLSAWEGALQIMAEHPWLGAGWNQPERMYDNYYRPVKSEEAAAIYLNDYFMLGATLGIPALFCFGMYIWLSLKQNSEFDKSEIRGVDWSKTVCRAGAIVLLVGFWFDGGLFNLPTASMFWILLELGVARSTPAKIAVPA